MDSAEHSNLEGQSRDFDMSLDDIIQRDSEDQTAPLAKFDEMGQPKAVKQYTFGVQPNLHGVARLRRGLPWKQSPSGMSPLNRQNFNQKVAKRDSWQEKIKRRQMQQKFNFRSQPTRRAYLRTLQMQQGQIEFNLNRRFAQQMPFNKRIKPLKTKRWQPVPPSGSVLTVCVPNPKAGQSRKSYVPAVQRLKQSGIVAPVVSENTRKRQSKGVPLKFNFKAVANQTNFTLNERFSTLKSRKKYLSTNGRGRTVSLI